MSLIRINRALTQRLASKLNCFSTASPQQNDEYTTPQYPPILDLSFEKRLERKKEAIHEEIRNVKTVEEKQIKLNMPRYYGFKSYMLFEEIIPYNFLTFVQHATRTHLIKNKELPVYYSKIEVENLAEISLAVQEALLIEIDNVQKSYDLRDKELSDVDRENIINANIAKQLNRVLNNFLVQKYPHIFTNEVDLNPRIESAWYVGGMNPPENIKRYRKGLKHMEKYENEPTDRLFNYIGSPMLTVRGELPLPFVISPTEAENLALDVPYFQYDPRVLGISTEHRHMANIPGFWPGDSHTFGLISYLKRGHLIERQKHINDIEDNNNAIISQAILSSYAWLHGQANYLGFTTFNDITYPLVTQTIVTNGKEFNFFVYQLNTILLHSKYINENPKRNICWASENLKLYDEVKDSKIIGFNEEVLKTLIKLYSNVPTERLGVNLRPYLGHDEKIIADYEDDGKRAWLEKEYKFLVCNRARAKEIPEIYSWEKIYKIDFKTRLIEKKRSFIDKLEKPHRRTLDSRLPAYIPRALRPDLPRNKGRWAAEYWP